VRQGRADLAVHTVYLRSNRQRSHAGRHSDATVFADIATDTYATPFADAAIDTHSSDTNATAFAHVTTDTHSRSLHP
jgi:hypothetical protein